MKKEASTPLFYSKERISCIYSLNEKGTMMTIETCKNVDNYFLHTKRALTLYVPV